MSDSLQFPYETDIPESLRIKSPVTVTEYLVNGEFHIHNGPFQKVKSPISLRTKEGIKENIIGSFPLLSKKEALMALNAATEAYDHGNGLWPSMTVTERLNAMECFLEQMKLKRQEVTNLLMWETAKPLKDSEKEFDRTVDYIYQTIAEVRKQENRSAFEVTQGVIGKIKKRPIGVVLCMGPFNYPLNETFTTLMPALLMGNTVIFKPAKIGVLLIAPLMEAFKSCFPKGVINIVFGRGRDTVGQIMETGKVDAFAFIGTSKSANEIKNKHPKPNRLRSVLALEAKNPAVLLPHADLDIAARECVMGSLSFNGQRCTAIKIIFVHTSIADKFIDKFTEAVKGLKRGMPWESNVFLTPLPEPDKPGYLKELIEDAEGKGAKVINDNGGRLTNTFFEPAVLYPVSLDMRVTQEEQFGPVIPIMPFDDINTVLEYLKDSDYGQQLSLFGNQAEEVGLLIDKLINYVCRINLNSQCQRSPDNFPFNGRKDSAYGTLSVTDALNEFSIPTVVSAKESASEKLILSDIVNQKKSKFLANECIL